MVEPYTQQGNIILEQQVRGAGVRVSYVGTARRLLDYGRHVNAPEPNSIPYIQKPRPLPQYAAIDLRTNGASHTYQALQVEAQRRSVAGSSHRDPGGLE
jgi:hypothetical protein